MNFKKYHVSRNLLEYYMSASPYIGTSIGSDGAIGGSNSYRVWVAKVTTGETYTISGQADVYAYYASEPIANETVAVDGTRHFVSSGSVITIPNGTSYIGVRTKIDEVAMLNTGSQPLPYEPYSSEVWHDIPRYIYNTSTDTITTLPAVLYPNAVTATVGLKGDMEQSSQPSPQTPIQPQECGDRTGNLCNNIPYKRNYYINENGVETSYNGFDIYKVSAIANTTYTLSPNASLSGSQVRIHTYSNGSWIEQTAIVNAQSLPATFTTPNNCDEIRFSINYAALDHIMLNSGSTALPYEPYGIKIPILSANTTTPVYLGEVESTRRIKKLVLDGTENWQTRTEGTARIFYLTNSQIPNNRLICTHYVVRNWADTQLYDNSINVSYTYAQQTINVHMDSYSLVDDFKAYLAQQYAAGTPVCVWYVLANPETAVVNEPLRKIGDYADTVSGITIPTIAGANTLSVGTTLQPSEVTVNYKGWHPVADVHEAGRTVNIYDKYNTIDMTIGKRYGIYVDNIGFYSIYNNTDNDVLWFDNNGQGRFIACSAHSTATVQITGVQPFGFFMPYNDESLGEVTIVQGSTVPDHYIPYIDWD